MKNPCRINTLDAHAGPTASLLLDVQYGCLASRAPLAGRRAEAREGHVKLIVQPTDGVTPLVDAINRAQKTLDLIIFRLDLKEIEKATEAALAFSKIGRAHV